VEYLHRIVEERIQKAREEGVFDNLPGRGKPLPLEDESWIPEELRLTYKVLKNANCLPIEMEMGRKSLVFVNCSIQPSSRKHAGNCAES